MNPEPLDLSQDIDDIYQKIEGCQTGVLYQCILHTQNGDEERAQEICNFFCIPLNQRSTLNDDHNIIARILGGNNGYKGVQLMTEAPVGRRSSKFKEQDPTMQYIILIIASFFLVGFYAFSQKKKPHERSASSSIYPDDSPAVPKQQPGYICLVVKARTLYELGYGEYLGRDQVIELITSATDFLCITQNQCRQIEDALDPLNEPLEKYLETSKEIYLRISTDNITPVLGKVSKLEIKSKLALSSYRLEKMDLLRTLSGLANFNHN